MYVFAKSFTVSMILPMPVKKVYHQTSPTRTQLVPKPSRGQDKSRSATPPLNAQGNHYMGSAHQCLAEGSLRGGFFRGPGPNKCHSRFQPYERQVEWSGDPNPFPFAGLRWGKRRQKTTAPSKKLFPKLEARTEKELKPLNEIGPSMFKQVGLAWLTFLLAASPPALHVNFEGRHSLNCLI